jgi:hypothetical protein
VARLAGTAFVFIVTEVDLAHYISRSIAVCSTTGKCVVAGLPASHTNTPYREGRVTAPYGSGSLIFCDSSELEASTE